jgi:hypothetical protein
VSHLHRLPRAADVSLPAEDPTDTVVKADQQSAFKLAYAKAQTTTSGWPYSDILSASVVKVPKTGTFIYCWTMVLLDTLQTSAMARFDNFASYFSLSISFIFLTVNLS